MTRDEVRAVPSHLSGVHHLMASLLYGSGLRLMECLRMRVKDLDFGQNHILVREGKGQGGALAGFVAWTSQKSDSTGAKKVCSQVQRISSARYLAHFFINCRSLSTACNNAAALCTIMKLMTLCMSCHDQKNVMLPMSTSRVHFKITEISIPAECLLTINSRIKLENRIYPA